MAEYTKWEAERHRSSGPAAAEKGGGGQAATGEGQSEDSDKDGRPLEPEKVTNLCYLSMIVASAHI